MNLYSSISAADSASSNASAIALHWDWQHLLQSFDVPLTSTQAAFDHVAQQYSSPNRHYHTLEHIQHVLQTIQQLKNDANNWAIVQLAAWFHDVIYDSQAIDNEEKSAAYANDLLSQLQLPNGVITATTRLILNTKYHQAEQADCNSHVLLDADLAILASHPNQYQQYCHAIRQEYDWVPEVEYRKARKRVLETFLQRETIYYTPQMLAVAEATARQNLNTEIETLKY